MIMEELIDALRKDIKPEVRPIKYSNLDDVVKFLENLIHEKFRTMGEVQTLVAVVTPSIESPGQYVCQVAKLEPLRRFPNFEDNMRHTLRTLGAVAYGVVSEAWVRMVRFDKDDKDSIEKFRKKYHDIGRIANDPMRVERVMLFAENHIDSIGRYYMLERTETTAKLGKLDASFSKERLEETALVGWLRGTTN